MAVKKPKRMPTRRARLYKGDQVSHERFPKWSGRVMDYTASGRVLCATGPEAISGWKPVVSWDPDELFLWSHW